MGDGADGTVPEGADVRSLARRLVWVVLLILPFGSGAVAGGANGPITFTVHVLGGSTKTSLRLQPGFATVLRADHRVDTVAIGDPRLVSATTVKRGQDVYDLVLQPQTATGATNMIVWFGDLTSIWDLTIGPGLRTADLVYVVTTPPPALQSKASPPLPVPSPARGTEAAPVALSSPTTAGAGSKTGGEPAQAPSAREAESHLEIQQALGDTMGIFQLFLNPTSITIRYRINNQGTTDFSIRPNGVVLKVNGRSVPFGMSRNNADKTRPALLPSGAAETGVINAPVRGPRQVEVIFALFPTDEDRQASNRAVPMTFQFLFAGLARLAVSGDR
jgi:putative type II/III system pilus formation protein